MIKAEELQAIMEDTTIEDKNEAILKLAQEKGDKVKSKYSGYIDPKTLEEQNAKTKLLEEELVKLKSQSSEVTPELLALQKDLEDLKNGLDKKDKELSEKEKTFNITAKLKEININPELLDLVIPQVKKMLNEDTDIDKAVAKLIETKPSLVTPITPVKGGVKNKTPDKTKGLDAYLSGMKK